MVFFRGLRKIYVSEQGVSLREFVTAALELDGCEAPVCRRHLAYIAESISREPSFFKVTTVSNASEVDRLVLTLAAEVSHCVLDVL